MCWFAAARQGCRRRDAAQALAARQTTAERSHGHVKRAAVRHGGSARASSQATRSDSTAIMTIPTAMRYQANGAKP